MRFRLHLHNRGDLEWLTAQMVDYWEGKLRMARLLEIKGLGADIAGVKKGIGDLRNAAAGLNTESAGLKAELADLTSQIKQHRQDLRFEAETLGNGGGNQLDDQLEPPRRSAGQLPDDGKTNSAPVSDSLEATANPVDEFHG